MLHADDDIEEIVKEAEELRDIYYNTERVSSTDYDFVSTMRERLDEEKEVSESQVKRLKKFIFKLAQYELNYLQY